MIQFVSIPCFFPAFHSQIHGFPIFSHRLEDHADFPRGTKQNFEDNAPRAAWSETRAKPKLPPWEMVRKTHFSYLVDTDLKKIWVLFYYNYAYIYSTVIFHVMINVAIHVMGSLELWSFKSRRLCWYFFTKDNWYIIYIYSIYLYIYIYIYMYRYNKCIYI